MPETDLALEPVLEHLDQQHPAAQPELGHHRDRVRVDRVSAIGAQAFDPQVIALARELINRIKTVPDHDPMWNEAGTGGKGTILLVLREM